MREFNSLRLVSFLFFPRGFTRFFWCCFCFFSLVFVNQVVFCFFLFSLSALFFASAPHSKTQEITLLSPWYVPSLSFRTFSLSLFSRRRGKGIRVALESALFTAGRFSRARDARRFFLTRCGFSANFWAKKKPSLPRRTSFKRKRRKSRGVYSRATSILSKLR